MKCCVCFDVQFDLDLPKEEIEKIINSDADNLNKGSLLFDLIDTTNGWVTRCLDYVDEAEITAIYSQESEYGEIPEIIWES